MSGLLHRSLLDLLLLSVLILIVLGFARDDRLKLRWINFGWVLDVCMGISLSPHHQSLTKRLIRVPLEGEEVHSVLIIGLVGVDDNRTDREYSFALAF